MKTGVRWLSTLLGSSIRAVMGLFGVAVIGATLTVSAPAQAQSVSDILNSLFGPAKTEKRSAAQPQAKPRPEPRTERASRPEPQRRAEPAKKLEKIEPVDPPVMGLPVTPGVPQLAVVTLGTQSLHFYSAGKLVESAPISSGSREYRTPTGVFTVIERNRDHVSNLYDDAPMPFMHRLTWSGIALHEGVLPGHPMSHGCIRLPKAFVERLWEISKVGMRVIVSPSPVEVVPVSSPLLFAPKFVPVPEDIAAYLTVERASKAGPTTLAEAKTTADGAVKSDAGAAGLLTVSNPQTAPSSAASKPTLKLSSQQIAALKTAAAGATSLNPIQASVVERIRAQALAPITQKAADEALAVAATASARANDASAELRVAEAAYKAAKAKLGDVAVEPTRTATPAIAVPAVGGVWSVVAGPLQGPSEATPAASPEAKARLEAQRLVLKAKARLDAARADDAVKSPAAFAAAANARQAVVAAEEADAASKVSSKRSSPISVLISAKDKRLYVRQGLNPVFDAPVIVRPGPEPIGTHTFQAVSATHETLNWVTVSVAPETLSDEARYMPFSKAVRTARAANKSLPADAFAEATPEPDAVPGSVGAVAALRALERFDLGPELTERLSELVWTGAWIIVTEQPLSKETGPIGTDHVVLTK